MLKGRQWRSPSTLLSIIGMMLGVACLVVAMAVVSGFMSTLEKTVVDVLGDMSVIKSGSFDEASIQQELEPLISEQIVASSPYLNLKAVYAEKGKVHGIVVEGVDPERVKDVTNLQNLIIEGEFDLSARDGVPGIIVGKELFRESDLKIGDKIRLVIPVADGVDAADFRSKLSRFEVRGVVHFGHHEFDTRYMLTDLASAQSFGEVGVRITGVRYKLQSRAQALLAKVKIQSELGYSYQVDTWKDYNKNLFEAAALEKMIIFFVLLVIVIAACFNVSATLFVSVVRRFRDISTLKTIGASSREIRRIFVLLGLLVGGVGSVMGMVLGYIVCLGFEYAQLKWGFILGSIYKVDHINFEIRAFDAFVIILVSMMICLVATLAPAIKGSRLSPAEGLRYD